MSEPTLVKTEFVLDLVNEIFDPEHRVEFCRPADEPGDTPHKVRLALDTWVDLGRPDHIRVTVQPGDLLNEPDGEG